MPFAVFSSSWVGGLSGGLTATVISTALVWWVFVPTGEPVALVVEDNHDMNAHVVKAPATHRRFPFSVVLPLPEDTQ